MRNAKAILSFAASLTACNPAVEDSSIRDDGGDSALDEPRDAWVGSYTVHYSPRFEFGGEHTEITLLEDGNVERRIVNCAGRGSTPDLFSWEMIDDRTVEIRGETGILFTVVGDTFPCGKHSGFPGGDQASAARTFLEGSYCPRDIVDDIDSSTTCLMDPCDARASACKAEYSE
ncbi:MAG: hypothetical protein AAGA54_30770 [Myxococcota bacterium]